jgi:hypothetical protein
MKKYLVFRLLIVLAFGISSCGSDDDTQTEAQDNLIGVWTLKSTENQGVDIPTVNCLAQQTVTYNSDFSGGESFPENEMAPCDFSTTNYTWDRNSNLITISVIEEGIFVNEILLLNPTQLQIVVIESNGFPVPQNQREIYKYEK